MGLKYRRKQSRRRRRRRRRRRWCGEKIPLIMPETINERWSMDFVSDSLSDGRSFRVFNIIDDYSREAIVQHVDFSIGGLRLVRVFEEIKKYRCLPKQLVCDNGTEFTSNAFRKWAAENNVQISYIDKCHHRFKIAGNHRFSFSA
jgi:putative transposase